MLFRLVYSKIGKLKIWICLKIFKNLNNKKFDKNSDYQLNKVALNANNSLVWLEISVPTLN